MKIRIEPYKTWSGGAKRLGQRAGILRATKRQVSKHGDFAMIINWGRSVRRFDGEYFNSPEQVAIASNKLKSAAAFWCHGVNQPKFTSEGEVARKWLEDGHNVLARTLLRASGGRGITLCTPEDDRLLPKAPMYTMYVPKKDEYRVHVWAGEVIDVQQKRRDTNVPDDQVNWQIRNHSNGFIYARSDISPDSSILSTAIAACAALSLDFGAVDLGWNQKRGECVVYEVNTAPGLEGTTLDSYYKALLTTCPSIQAGMYKTRRASRGY